MTRLTTRRLQAMASALAAALAGEEGEGDMEGVSHHDLDAAAEWVAEQINKREAKAR